ncbi:MAG: hypothetical protein ACYDIC_00485 [Desulfobaccales bacterium]
MVNSMLCKSRWWWIPWVIGLVALMAVVLVPSFPAYAQTKKDRDAYAATIPLRIFFNNGIEMNILTEGPKGTTLRIECAKLTDPEQMITPKRVAMWKKLGFRHVIITNGDRTWKYDVNKLH